MIAGIEEKAPPRTAKDRPATARLSLLETEVIDLLVQFSRLLGQPKSVAEIYGLLFVSPRALSMEETMERLQMSKGSTSQGLRFLRSVGAVRQVYVPGQRAAHFEAVAQLRIMVARFLRDQILAHLDGSLDRIDRLPALVRDLPPDQRDLVRARIGMLESWQKKTRKVLPIVLRILGA
jgi:DNA-binding transcriptional regulator GbsR (MarR family)